MAKREPLRPLRIPLSFDEAVKVMLGTPPPPKDVPGVEQRRRRRSGRLRKDRQVHHVSGVRTTNRLLLPVDRGCDRSVVVKSGTGASQRQAGPAANKTTTSRPASANAARGLCKPCANFPETPGHKLAKLGHATTRKHRKAHEGFFAVDFPSCWSRVRSPSPAPLSHYAMREAVMLV